MNTQMVTTDLWVAVLCYQIIASEGKVKGGASLSRVCYDQCPV